MSWEYLTVTDRAGWGLEPYRLAQLGAEGWELVTSATTRNGTAYYFKRPRKED